MQKLTHSTSFCQYGLKLVFCSPSAESPESTQICLLYRVPHLLVIHWDFFEPRKKRIARLQQGKGTETDASTYDTSRKIREVNVELTEEVRLYRSRENRSK